MVARQAEHLRAPGRRRILDESGTREGVDFLSFRTIRRTALSVAIAAAWLTAGPARSDGPVVAWGDDTYGQATPPDLVDGDAGTASAIAAGDYHSCAIQAGIGKVVCWGDNTYGQATPPAEVDGTAGAAIAIAAGASSSCAIQ